MLKTQDKAPKFQHLTIPYPTHKHQNIPLKKWHTKKNKETAESAKLLFKRIKEAKEKH